jgi:hypothetical protein
MQEGAIVRLGATIAGIGARVENLLLAQRHLHQQFTSSYISTARCILIGTKVKTQRRFPKEGKTMNRYIAMDTNETLIPVLFLDSEAPIHHLQQNANQRIQACVGLLEAITSVTVKHSEDIDLFRFTYAAYLLGKDGLTILNHISHRISADTNRHDQAFSSGKNPEYPPTAP